MKGRAALLTIVLLIGVMAGGGAVLERVGARKASALAGGQAPSGAWYCPHGGGAGWTAQLSLANPGSTVVPARIETFSQDAPPATQDVTVKPGASMRVTVPADSRERASMVEYFGGWIAAGWVAVAGGNESGVTSEPCLSESGKRWFLPDGTTIQGQEANVVVMNPFAAQAVFTVSLYTEQRQVSPKDWGDFVLDPNRSVAFHLNDQVLGDRTAATEIAVSSGRVAAASLGVAVDGGVRSAVGVTAPVRDVYLPGAGDSGRTELAVFDPGQTGAGYSVSVLGLQGRQPSPGLTNEALGPVGDRTYEFTTAGPSAVEVRASGKEGIVAARRTFGSGGDQGSTVGAPPGRAFLLLPVAPAPGGKSAIALTNPGTSPVSVRLAELGHQRSTVTVTIPPGSTVDSGASFVATHPLDAVLAVAASGAFVPVETATTADGKGYEAAAGVAIPPRWIPA